jgi:hypothetical protein
MAGVLKAKVDGQWVIVTAAGAGGGTGVDEVAVSNTDPGVSGTHELWFDPDATTPTNVIGRWNSAWGIISVGTFPAPLAPHSVPAGVSVLSNPLAATLITGRRYRVGFQSRAITGVAGNNISFYLRDNGTEIRGTPYGGDPYVYIQGNYHTMQAEWWFNGDNTPHSFEVMCASSSACSVFTDYGLFYIEDVGPISYGQPPAVDPTPTAVQWTPMTLNAPWIRHTGYTWSGPAYRKVGDIVYLRGLLTTEPTSVSDGSQVAVLPAGYRPSLNLMFVLPHAKTSANFAAARIDVYPDGALYYGYQGAGAVNYMSFANLSFSVTP